MGLTLLVGGARSGKSTLALELVGRASDAVTFIATAEARDEEMATRIAAHRSSRPSSWTTLEEPLELGDAVASVGDDRDLIVDCLTLWVANLIERGDDDQTISAAASRVAFLASSREAKSVVISNEVGSGLVPMDPLGRRYRDLLGQVNAIVAASSERALLVVAGRLLTLQALSDLDKATSR